MSNDFKTEILLTELGLSFKFDLHKSQCRALEYIMEDKGLLVVLPTGMGKTILAVMACLKSNKIKNKKCLVMAPLRALTNEHVTTFREYNINTMIDNGEHSKTTEDYERGDFDAVISTFEKMDSIIRTYSQAADNRGEPQRRDIVFNQIDTIVIDEIHNIEDSSRGVNLESFILTVRYLYPHIKIIGLSATIGNYKEFAEWLKVPIVYEPPEMRPVPLLKRYREIYSYYARQQYAEKMEILRRDVDSHPTEKRMIAVTSVNRTKQIVYDLCGIRGYNKPPIKQMMRKYRMAWHYSGSRGMTEDDRMAVEWAFEYDDLPDDENYFYEAVDDYICRKDWLRVNYNLTHGINIIVCTPTLIVGRNLPVTYIDVFDHIQFTYKEGPVIIGANRLQQTMGRAGRLKFAYYPDGTRNLNYKGIATFYVQSNDMDEVKNRVENPLEIVSHLKHHLSEKILAWINSRIVSDEKSICKFLENALDKTISLNIELIKKRIEFLSLFKFILANGENLKITQKGLKTIRYYIQPESVVTWGKLISKYIGSKEKVKLSKFITESMNVEEHYQNIVAIRRDIPIIVKMRGILGYPDVTDQAIKSFIFCFPTFSRKKLEINEDDYMIPDGESASMRTQFDRMITAFADIYNYTTLKKVLEPAKYMIRCGVFNPKLGKLMSIKGIGSAYALRLLKNDITSKKQIVHLYKTNRRKLIAVLQITAARLKNLMANVNE